MKKSASDRQTTQQKKQKQNEKEKEIWKRCSFEDREDTRGKERRQGETGSSTEKCRTSIVGHSEAMQELQLLQCNDIMLLIMSRNDVAVAAAFALSL